MRKLLLSVCAAAACWISDAGAMNGSNSVCEARSLGRGKEDVALLRCEKFPNLERIELEDERAWVFFTRNKNNKESFPKLEKITGYANADDDFSFSVYDYDYSDDEDSADSTSGLKIILQGMTELPVVEEIYLEGWNIGLAGGLPESIGNLKSLRVLKLKCCGLQILPESIGHLENLEILDLSNIRTSSYPILEDNYIGTLPETIGNLKNLKELNLAGCRLSELPKTIGNLENLQILNLYGSYLRSLPESIKKLSKLKKLSFSGGVFYSKPFPDIIFEMPSVEEIIVDEELEKGIPVQRIRESVLPFVIAWKNHEKWNDQQLKSHTKLRINGIPFSSKN